MEPGASRDGPKFVAHRDKRDKSKPLAGKETGRRCRQEKGRQGPLFFPFSLSPCLTHSMKQSRFLACPVCILCLDLAS